MSNLFTMRNAAATAVLALTLGLGASSTFAQGSDDVTVMLRSGERVAGRLEDLNNGTLFIRVSTHDQRKWPITQVALIDYLSGAQGLPQGETSSARGNDHVLVLRNGQAVSGRLVDIEGGVGFRPAG